VLTVRDVETERTELSPQEKLLWRWPQMRIPEVKECVRQLLGVYNLPTTTTGLLKLENYYKASGVDVWNVVGRLLSGFVEPVETMCWVRALRSVDSSLPENECFQCSRNKQCFTVYSGTKRN